MNYKLVVDSGCDLAPKLLEEPLKAETVPLTMTVDDRVYVDDDNLDLAGFIDDMNSFKGKVMSACPSPQSFNEAFEEGKTNFVVTLSSQLSGSYSSAKMAQTLAEEDGKDVYVFDSKSASAGEMLVSLKIKELVEKGLHKEAIIEKVENFIDEMHTFFVLENLDNLMKNGRMNKIVVKLATVMQIRPILGDDGNGNIAFYSKVRGTAAAIDSLCKTIGEYCKDTREKILTITHCGNETQANRLKKMAEDMYHFKDIVVTKTRGLSSMYANLGGVVIAF